MATVAQPMTEPDPSDDPDDDAIDSAGAEQGTPESGSAGGTDRRATPRLANAADTTEEEPVNDPAAVREPEPIEPEGPRAENALFVLLGVLGTVALLATAIVPGVL